MRAVSTIRMMNNDSEISSVDGLINRDDLRDVPNISYRFVVFNSNPKAVKTIIITGSMTAETVISRELPIPPKVLPASNPANAIKNLAKTSKYKKRMILPKPAAIPGIYTTGTHKDATSMHTMLM